jgi:hypothetical protein
MPHDRLAAARRRPRRTLVAAGLALVLVAVGCDATKPSGSIGPSASPSSVTSSSPAATTSASAGASASISPELAKTYRDINAQVREIRGLQEKQPVTPTILSKAQMATLLEQQLNADSPPELLSAYERLYHAMGVLPKDQHLADVYVDLLESQVAGLYVPTDKKLYVVSEAGEVGPLEKVFYSHEYTHALQDQNHDLDGFQPDSLKDQSDRQLARQALVEGDAYVTMTYWLQQHLTSSEMQVVLNNSQDQAAQEALKRIPPIVASQIVFAALEGTVWVLGLQLQGGFAAVDAAFDDPPESTEQVLHADKWASREPPIDVQLPADLATRLGSGWSVGLQDTFGEHQLGVWISAAVPTGGLPTPPPEAVAGWGGDRVALLDGPDGRWAVALKTQWDADKDAAEFEAGIAKRVAEAGGPGQVLPGEGGRVRWIVIGSDDATLGQVANALGLAG